MNSAPALGVEREPELVRSARPEIGPARTRAGQVGTSSVTLGDRAAPVSAIAARRRDRQRRRRGLPQRAAGRRGGSPPCGVTWRRDVAPRRRRRLGHALTARCGRPTGPARSPTTCSRRWDAYRDALRGASTTLISTRLRRPSAPRSSSGASALATPRSPTDAAPTCTSDGLAGGDGPLRASSARRAADRRAARAASRLGRRDRPRAPRRPLNARSAGSRPPPLRSAPVTALPPGPAESPAAADRALARAADPLPRGLPAALRRRVQRDVPGLQDAAGDGLAPGGDPRAVRRARAPRCRPGRQVTLKPLVGARSLLLLEGAEHL